MLQPFRLLVLLGVVGPGLAVAAPRDVSAGLNLSFESLAPPSPCGSSVSTVLQTSDGFLWLGTESGLVRYDGVQFTAYSCSNTPAFSGHSVRCLHEDAAGDLWVATESELVRCRAGRFARIGFPGLAVTAIAEDARGLWLGTHGTGLFRWEQGELRRLPAEQELDGANIAALLVDTRGVLWIGLQNRAGLWQLRGDRIRSLEVLGVEKLDSVRALAEQSDALWIGTARHGLFCWREGTLTHCEGEGVELEGPVWSIAPSMSGGPWLIADALYKVKMAPAPVVALAGRPRVEFARDVCEDREGNVWIAAKSDGLLRARQLPATALTTESGLPGNAVRTVAEDTAGNLWLTIDRHGVTRVSPTGAVTVFADTDAASPRRLNRAPMARPFRDGSVWVRSGRMFRIFRDGAWTTPPDAEALRSIFQDRQGRVWIGAEQHGLAAYRDGVLIDLRLPSGRSIDSVPVCFSENSAGTIFVGTWDAGLFQIEGERVSSLGREAGLPTDEVRAVHVDREDRVWAGLRSRGLAVLQDGRWLNPDALSLAVGHHVMAIADDEFGRLWIGTLGGILWAPKSEVVAAARGLGPMPRWHELSLPGGGPAAVLTGIQPIVWEGRDRRLFFATQRGVMIIDPRLVAPEPVPPPIRVEAVLADGVRLAPGAELPPQTRQLAIHYTTPTFVQPKALRFRYQLEGFDRDWIEAGARREAIYTNVPPGRYQFRVRASNSDGQWSEDHPAVALMVVPFFWQRMSFRIATAAVSCLLGIAVVRAVSQRRLRRKLALLERRAAVDAERARIAKDIHDDLGGSLTELNLLLALIDRDAAFPDGVVTHAERARLVTQHAIKSMDETVWAVNPGNDTLSHLIDYVGQFAAEFLQAAGLQGRFELPEHPPALPVTAEVRHNVFLIVKEALNNCVRHGGASAVALGVRIAGDRMRIEIVDNGQGIRAGAEHANADGLRNMRSRTEAIRGEFSLVSAVGGGTKIQVNIPLPCAAPAAGECAGLSAARAVIAAPAASPSCP